MLFQTYDHTRYNKLNPFYVAEDLLPAAERSIEELGQIICDHGMQDTVGVALLHKHFDIAADERVVRRYEKNGAYIAPETPSVNHVACLWEFDGCDDGIWFPLEFSDRTSDVACFDQAEQLEGNESFLVEFSDALQRLTMQRLFGLAALHGFQILNPSDDQMVLETGGDAQRSLKLEVVNAMDPRGIGSTQTLWMFENAIIPSEVEYPASTGAMTCAPISHGGNCKKHRCYHCHPISHG